LSQVWVPGLAQKGRHKLGDESDLQRPGCARPPVGRRAGGSRQPVDRWGQLPLETLARPGHRPGVAGRALAAGSSTVACSASASRRLPRRGGVV